MRGAESDGAMTGRYGTPGGRSPAPYSLLAVGAVSMLGQVALLRELSVASFGVELIYLLGVALWLAAGAAGAVLGRVAPGAGAGRSPLSVPFLLLSLLLPLAFAFLRGARHLFGGVPGAYLPLGQQAATALLAMVPAGFLLGLLFRRAALRWMDRGGTLASAYAWESAGGAGGSVAATLSLHLGISNLAVGLACALACALAAVRTGGAGRPRRFLLPLPAAALLAVLLGSSGPLDRWSTAWNHPGLAALGDTPYGRAAVTRADGQVVLFVNDALVYESEGTEAEEFVHVAALQAPDRPRIAVLGSGSPGIAREASKHAPSLLHLVDGNRPLARVLVPHLPPETREALREPAARTIFDDPRRFLRESGARYDLILVAAPEPSSAESNRFYTREFFRLCLSRLTDRGLVALRLPSSENFWTPGLIRRNGSVHAALRSAGAGGDVLVIPGGTDLLLASPRAPLVRDPEILAQRLARRGIRGRLVSAPYLRYLLTNDRLATAERLLAGAGEAANTDARPVCFLRTIRLWLDRFLPARRIPFPPARTAAIVLPALSLLLILLARRRSSARRVALAGAAGFAGMAVEGVVLLRFQAETGSLYQDIGLLLTSFMAGLSAGAFLFDRAAASREVRRAWGAGIVLGLSALCGGLALAAERAGFLFRLVPSAAFLASAAMLTAALFSFAGRHGLDRPEEAVGPLYAADLAGGCAGSVLAGLLLVPLFGAAWTAGGVALLAAVALLLL